MAEEIQVFYLIIILVGLGANVTGAFILIRSSGKLYEFFMQQMNRTTNDEIEEKKTKLMQKQKRNTQVGLFFLLWGFVIQIIGYVAPLFAP